MHTTMIVQLRRVLDGQQMVADPPHFSERAETKLGDRGRSVVEQATAL